jgi:hypothetical protein
MPAAGARPVCAAYHPQQGASAMDITDAPTPPIEQRALLRRHSRPPGAWDEFLAWPAATSLVTLLSAACLLGGMWGVLAPVLGEAERLAPRWQVLATLSAYLGCLLAGIWAMCRVRAGNPDAVASAVVGSALAMGFGVVLGLLATHAPGWATAAGLVGALGLIGLGRGFARVAGGWQGWGPGLAILAAWSCLWPVWLGRVVVGGDEAATMAWWSVGWAALLVWGGVAASACERATDDPAGTGELLGSVTLRRVLALVSFAVCVAALGVQAHVGGLDLVGSDLLPHLLVLLVAADAIATHRAGAHPLRAALAIAVPALLAAWWSGAASGGSARGSGFAPAAVELMGGPVVLPLAAAVLGAVLAWRRRSAGPLWGGAIALLAAILAWRPQDPGIAISASGALLLAVGTWRPQWIAMGWARTSGVVVGLAAAGEAGRLLHGRAALFPGLLWLDACAVLLAVGLILAAAARRRDGLLVVAALPAACVGGWPVLRRILPDAGAWWAVWLAFALLGSGVLLAVRRARQGA